ncbi:MAG: 30S ribosomal protein S6 [Oscillochloris sp.]|nr:30S ribosomal protein S6 [Oscillochloris sp.]
MRERRRSYELMIIISPLAANEEGIAAVMNRLTNTIESGGGEVTAINQSSPWGRRKLAYPIRSYVTGEASRRNFSEGYYVLIHFNLSASQVGDVERTIKLTDTILRHLITQVEQKGSSEEAPVVEEAVAETEEHE